MNERYALGYGLAAVLLWSTVATAFKITLDYFTPSQMMVAASVISAIALGVIAFFQGKLHLLGRTFIARPFYYLLLGLINPFAYYLVLARGLRGMAADGEGVRRRYEGAVE